MAKKSAAVKRVLKSREQLIEEARFVHQLVFESGEKYMPEKEGIRYHVISMQWINKWKIYVDYDKQFGSQEE